MPELINKEVAQKFFKFKDEDMELFSLDEALKKWAEVHYPNTKVIDQCAFAGLTAYFITGAYGGYGTELYNKERVVEHKTVWLYNSLVKKLNDEQLSEVIILFVISHLLQRVPMSQDVEDEIKKTIEGLESTKSSFKSKQIAEIKNNLEKLLSD